MNSRGGKLLRGLGSGVVDVLSTVGENLEAARSYLSDSVYEYWFRDEDYRREQIKARADVRKVEAENRAKKQALQVEERVAKEESNAKLKELKEQMKTGEFEDLSDLLKLNIWANKGISFNLSDDGVFLSGNEVSDVSKAFAESFKEKDQTVLACLTALGIDKAIDVTNFTKVLVSSFSNYVLRFAEKSFKEQFPQLSAFDEKYTDCRCVVSFGEDGLIEKVDFFFKPDGFVERYEEFARGLPAGGGGVQVAPEQAGESVDAGTSAGVDVGQGAGEQPSASKTVDVEAVKEASSGPSELEASRLAALRKSPLGALLGLITFSTVDPDTNLSGFDKVARGMNPFIASIAGFLGVEGYMDDFNSLAEIIPEEHREALLAEREVILEMLKPKTERPEAMQEFIEGAESVDLVSYLSDNFNGLVGGGKALKLSDVFGSDIKIDLSQYGSFVYIPKGLEYAISDAQASLAKVRSSADKAFASGIIYAKYLPKGAIISPGAIISRVI